MTDKDVLTLRRELERTKKNLETSLKLNSVLEKSNRDLERRNNKAAALREIICGDVDRVRGMVSKVRGNFKMSSAAALVAHGQTAIDDYDKQSDGATAPCWPSSAKRQRLHKVLGRPNSLQRSRKCPYCPYTSYNAANYSKHVRRHSKPNFRARPKLWTSVKSGVGSSTTGHGSSVSKTAMEDSESNMSLMANEGPSKTDFYLEPRKAMEDKLVGKLHCNKCSKVFKFKSVLDGHRRFCDAKRGKTKPLKAIKDSSTEHGRKTFECQFDRCDYKTKWTTNLKVHVLRVHQDQRPWACGWEECDKTFFTKDTRDDHVLRVHSDERPFGCSDCDKWFVAAGDLTRHRKSVIHASRAKNKATARSAKLSKQKRSA